MTNRREKLEAIFEAAAAMETEAQRSEYLDRACPDADIRSEVESLLQAMDQPDSLFGEKETMSSETLDEAHFSEQTGTRVGRYKLLEKLGEGGFGSVWAAEQREPVRRRVALKIIKLGMDTKQVVARFEAERQALALMDHPNIAKVLDAGATDTGRPYFVMELVKGVPITRYCLQERLSTNEQLDLFIKVCQAIQHAHQKGIIHRDIKPSNIMVTLHDGVPVPKVIDFGIAKATQAELTEKTIYTQYSQFIGTPAYMSPEQAEMSGLDIDTRSDIYSLGVLLYELLTETTPFEAHELMQSGLDEMRKIIREREPVRPSTRLSQTLVAAEATGLKPSSSIQPATGHKVRASSRRLRAQIPSDLDWIVMRCLEKDRTRRYETANGLVSDIKRHLESEPIVARPPSFVYRFRKAFHRNRLACSAGIIVAAALVIAVVGTSAGMIRAERERAAAEEAKRLAEERFNSARQFVESLAEEVAPEFQGLIGASKAKEALASASVEFLESMGEESKLDPVFQFELGKLYSSLADALGAVYSPNSIGDFETALRFADKSLSMLRPLHDKDPEDAGKFRSLARSLDQTGNLLTQLDRGDEAMTRFRELDDRIRARILQKPDDSELLRVRELTQLRLGHLVRAKGDVERALEEFYLPASAELLELEPDPSLPGDTAHSCFVAHILIGGSLYQLDRVPEARDHFETALDWKRVLVGREPNDARHARDWSEIHTWKGSVLIEQGHHEEGMALHDEGVRLAEALVKRDPANAMSQRQLVSALRWQGEGRSRCAKHEGFSREDQITLSREAVEILRTCAAKLESDELSMMASHSSYADEVNSALQEANFALAMLAQDSLGESPTNQ